MTAVTDFFVSIFHSLQWFFNVFDLSILRFFDKYFNNPILDKIMLFFTLLGEKGIVFIAAAVLLLFFKRFRRTGILILGALLVTFLCCEFGIKLLVERPRPFVTYPEFQLIISPPHGYSFPSSHAATSFAVAAVLCYCHKKLSAVFMLTASLIALSRVYLLVHYPTDIIAGMVLGSLLAMLSIYILNKIFKFPANISHIKDGSPIPEDNGGEPIGR